MTNREFYTAIAAIDTLSEDLRNFASDAITKMDLTNERRKAKPSKAAIANAPMVDKIVDTILSDKVMTASEVAVAYGEGIKVQKASNLLRTAVAQGRATVEDVKVKGKGIQKGYRKA